LNRFSRLILSGLTLSSFAQAQQPVPPPKTPPPVAPIIKPPAPLQPPAAQAPAGTPEENAKAAFKKGVNAYQQKQFDQAVAAFTQVPELGSGFMSLYKHWFLGNSYLELAKYKEAESEFSKVIAGQQATTEMKYQAQFNLGEAALRQKKYSDAVARLQPLERKWRHSYRYPEVLYRLMTADLRTNKIANACKRAKKLYSKYPAHVTVIGWGSVLSDVTVDGKKLPCVASQEDFSDRIRSLQWAGESEKAHNELTDKIGKTSASDKLHLDMVLANFLVNEGSVDDALNLLVRYYPTQKSSLPYLTLLGKAAARSGEYQTAVGAYERAYSLSSNSKKGREALFQAAYLSYQFQDYDGAVRKFQQFMKRNPNSGLARDAQWHLAWLQYLRSDYRGALEKFAQVGKLTSRRRRRNNSDQLQDRLLYWTAMAHIRLGEFAEAKIALDKILTHSHYSYYGLAAEARLESIKDKIEENKPTLALNRKLMPMEAADDDSSDSAAQAPPAGTPADAAQAAANTVAAANDEQAESEDTINETDDEITVSKDDEADEEQIHATDFKDPKLRARIDVATKLIQFGLPELARWELIEVEKRTRNKQYLRMLISAYEGIIAYNRSASIADLNFARERESNGLDGAKGLWIAAFPQAFKPAVLAASKRFSVPQEWVWAIMRTESMYKTDVVSPVGAKGLMQLMPLTARNLYKLAGEAVPDGFYLLNHDTNVRLGGQYLARLMLKFNGQLPLVAAAYNSGPHRVESWLISFGHLETDEFVEHIPFAETRNYVKKVVRNYTLYRRIYAQDQKPDTFLAKALGVPIPTRAATRESWETL